MAPETTLRSAEGTRRFFSPGGKICWGRHHHGPHTCWGLRTGSSNVRLRMLTYVACDVAAITRNYLGNAGRSTPEPIIGHSSHLFLSGLFSAPVFRPPKLQKTNSRAGQTEPNPT